MRSMTITCGRCGLGVQVEYVDDRPTRVFLNVGAYGAKCKLGAPPLPEAECPALVEAIEGGARVH